VSCHNLGPHGAGARDDNIFQAGDGADLDTTLERNPPALRGLGIRQAIAAEISAALQAQRLAAQQAAEATGLPQEVALCVAGDAVCFGTLRVEDGEIDAAGVEGIDGDLVVRPFGWKGREPTLRRFVRGGFRVHFGMQAADAVDECPSPSDWFVSTWGDGGCPDPDEDGIAHELGKRQLDAVAVYLAKLPPPPASPPSKGPALMEAMQCTGCHVRLLPLGSDTLDDEEVGVPVELPALPGPIALWTDFKRHDLGGELADRKDFVNEPSEQIAARQFITPPLWDLARSAPYLHDGRAATLREAIQAHGEEGAAARSSFLAASPADQDALLGFLASLGAP